LKVAVNADVDCLYVCVCSAM